MFRSELAQWGEDAQRKTHCPIPFENYLKYFCSPMTQPSMEKLREQCISRHEICEQAP
jgi:hypothetical protein